MEFPDKDQNPQKKPAFNHINCVYHQLVLIDILFRPATKTKRHRGIKRQRQKQNNMSSLKKISKNEIKQQ